ncbi:MAG: helix-hairpin-helix domain-containing protein [Odoribacteraceae bacterium]|nr:helix-hairpin-helix domain-containing protein [Odoribacteraceae bacterium]
MPGYRENPPFLLARAGSPASFVPRVDTVVARVDTARPPARRPPRRPVPLELNGADSLALVKIRGIGPRYASRILRYREQLGGFHDAGQLKELRFTYLDIDTLLPLFTVDASLVRKQAMDTMTFRSLLRHPYLEYEDVVLIFNAKRAAGDSLSYSLLERKKVLVPRKLKKIKPYFY